MNSVKGLLRNTMEDLCEKDLKKMKHLLRDDGKIMWSKLEHADGDDIVDLIVEVYTEEKSVETVINKLKHMNLNQRVEDLQKHLADVKADNPASQSDDSTVPTTERGFMVGDRVRVRASVVEPKHKWANVTHSSVGVVKAFKPSGLMLVDFPGQPGWTAEPSEMELQGFVVGDRVRVKTTVKEPKHKWGSVTHSSVGVVKDFIPNGQMLVDFPGHSAWRADPSEMEYQGFMVGDRVRVKASVEEPKYKWGEVTHSSVGVVKAFTQNGLMLVDFPGVTGWTADPADMELLGFLVGDRVRVKASVVEPKFNWGNATHSSVGVVKVLTQNSLMLVDFPGESNWKADPVEMEYIGFIVGDRVRVKASVQSPKQGWGKVTHSSVGVVKAFTPDGRMLVDFPGQPKWRADPSEMELRGFVVGDRVQVRASVKEPKYKWGELTHRSVGVVKAFQTNGIMLVDFPGIPRWRADPNEMDLQDSDDEEDDDTSGEDEQDDDDDDEEVEGEDGSKGFSVGDKVRVKASVQQPKYKWGNVTRRSVGVVKAFQTNGIMLVDFPGIPRWRADPNEMDLQDSDDEEDDDTSGEDKQDDDDDDDDEEVEREDGSKGFSVGDKVRVKASVQQPKYKWGNVTRRSVGVVKAFIKKGVMLVNFREDSSWRADPADMELAL